MSYTSREKWRERDSAINRDVPTNMAAAEVLRFATFRSSEQRLECLRILGRISFQNDTLNTPFKTSKNILQCS